MKDLIDLFRQLTLRHRANIIGGTIYFLLVLFGLACAYLDYLGA